MLERTVVTAVQGDGEAEAKRLVDLNPNHAVYTAWDKLGAQLSKSSCAPLFLVLVCQASKLEDQYPAVCDALLALKKNGSLPIIVLAALGEGGALVSERLGLGWRSAAQRLAEDLDAEARGTRRALRAEEVARSLAFARSGIGNFLQPVHPSQDEEVWTIHERAGIGARAKAWAQQLSYVALVRACTHHAKLDESMEADNTWTRAEEPVKPTKQLKICLEEWEKAAIQDSVELAMCVYTTYFYKKLNTPLRNYLEILKDSSLIRELIYATTSWLMAGFKAATPCLIRTFRMELQAEWIKDARTGDFLPFPGFTSTHPTLEGVNAMRGDIQQGSFGAVTKPALLVFEGRCPVLRPRTKYFVNENEYILPAGVKLRIAAKYEISWCLRGDQEEAISVYHLEPTEVLALYTDLLDVKVLQKREPPPDATPGRCKVSVVDDTLVLDPS